MGRAFDLAPVVHPWIATSVFALLAMTQRKIVIASGAKQSRNPPRAPRMTNPPTVIASKAKQSMCAQYGHGAQIHPDGLIPELPRRFSPFSQ